MVMIQPAMFTCPFFSILTLTIIMGLSACKPEQNTAVPETTPPVVSIPSAVESLAAADAAIWIEKHPDGLILDLRMQEEVQREGKLASSVNHDFLRHDSFQTFIDTVPKDRPILLICALGGRSQKAAVELSKMGYSNLALLIGGQEAWQAEARPVQK